VNYLFSVIPVAKINSLAVFGATMEFCILAARKVSAGSKGQQF
jgi:hypothetical protein